MGPLVYNLICAAGTLLGGLVMAALVLVAVLVWHGGRNC
jgi:hypothetical protein